MADIDIEKKKPVWPWIILVLVILAILYFLIFAGDDDADDLDETTTEQVEDTTVWEDQDENTAAWDTEDTTGQAVSDYIAYVGDKSRMGIDHTYTNNALVELTNAVESKAQQENVDITADMQEIRQDAQEVTEDPMATDHANIIRNTGAKIVDALEKIQQESYPDLSGDIENLRNSLQEIDPSVQTLEQKEDVNSFFDQAADVLRNMS